MPEPVNVGINSIQIMGRASGLIGPDGRIKTNLSIDSGDGVRLNLSAASFPFLRPQEPVFVAIVVMQVNPTEPVILDATPKLIV